MRDIEQIADPTWQDIMDREIEIRRLTQTIEELKADLREKDTTISGLNERLRHKIALLGVP